MNSKASTKTINSKASHGASFKKKRNHLVMAPLMVLTIFSRLIKYTFHILLARTLSDRIDLYGDFSIGLYTAQILAGVLLFGSSLSALTFLSKYINLGKMNLAISFVRWNFRGIAGTFFIFLFVYCLFVISITGLHLFQIHALEEHKLVVYMLCFAPFIALGILATSFLLCTHHFFCYKFTQSIAFYLLGALILLLNIYFFKFPIATTESLYVFSFILVGVFAFMCVCLIFLKIPNIAVPGCNFFSIDIKYGFVKHSSWLKTSLNLLVPQLLFQLLINSNLYTVGFLSTDKTNTGKYAAIITLGVILYVLGTTLCNLLAPDISTLVAKRKVGVLQKSINKTNLINLLMSLPLTIVFCSFPKEILGTFGKSYVGVDTPFRIYCVIMLFRVLTYFPKVIAQFSNNEKIATRIGALELCITIASGIPLIYFFGLIGAALSLGIASIFDAVAFTRIVRKKVGVKPLTFV